MLCPEWTCPQAGEVSMIAEYRLWCEVYEVKDQIALPLIFADAKSAQHVRFSSDANTDKGMKRFFRIERDSRDNLDYGLAIRNGVSFDFLRPGFRLRESLAYRFVFREDNGLEYELGREFGLKGGTPGGFAGITPDFAKAVKKLGKHKGTLILETDKEAAEMNPLIESCWEGRIEWPIEFELYLRSAEE